jgi:hypothetical protein
VFIIYKFDSVQKKNKKLGLIGQAMNSSTLLLSSYGGACKVSRFELVYKFVNKFYRIWIPEILYNALLRN